MPRFKVCDYRQKLMIPVSLEEQLVPGTLEHAIHHLIDERVDDSWFEDLYTNDQTGRPAYSPRMLLKVILLGYSRGLLSSRRIERACRENVTFMALCGGEHPDHSTFAGFIGRLDGRIGAIFSEVLLICHEEGLLGGTHFSLDGIKLAANASRENSGTFEDLRHKLKKLEAKLAEHIAAHAHNDRREQRQTRRKSTGADEQAQRDAQRREQSIDRLRRKSQQLREFLATHEPKQGAKGEIQSNATDNESARMHTSHGTIQGYNAQALVDSQHQVIVHGEAMGAGQDFRHVAPMLEGAAENLAHAGLSDAVPLAGAQFSADCNYHSEENLIAVERAGVDAYIPDPQFRSRDPRFATQIRHKAKAAGKETMRFTLAHFSHQRASDTYRCPNGKVLQLEAATARDQRGNIYRRYQARVEDCARCPFRKDCLQRGAKQRSLHVPKATEHTATRSRQMRAKIDLPESRTIYAKRLAIVEPVFANIRVQKGMNHFTYRGQAKVNIQWLLFCLVHNLERIAHFGTQWLEKAVEKAWRAARRDFQSFPEAVCAVCTFLFPLFVTTATPADRSLSLANAPRSTS
jgi:transposase